MTFPPSQSLFELIALYMRQRETVHARSLRIDEWWVGAERADGSSKFYAIKAAYVCFIIGLGLTRGY